MNDDDIEMAEARAYAGETDECYHCKARIYLDPADEWRTVENGYVQCPVNVRHES